MSRDKAWAVIGFLCLAVVGAAVAAVVNLLAALDDPAAWSGFVITLAAMLAAIGLIVLVRRTMAPRDGSQRR